MPRTKKVNSAAKRNSKALTKSDKLAHNTQIGNFWKDFEAECKTELQYLDAQCTEMINKMSIVYQNQKMKCTSVFHKTLEELEAGTGTTLYASVKDISNFNSVLASSTSQKLARSRRMTNRRNRSGGEDEGYLTAGSRASSETRQSRAAKKLATAKKNTKRSRSTSNTNRLDPVEVIKEYTTPQNKQPPFNAFGYITPKVKPNAPQPILRRPVLGEMAFSVEGSPLMTYDFVPNKANVNIPLSNGKAISLQPHRGLRLSQIPDMDEDTLEQVKVLHDNLSKMIGIFEQ